PDPRSVACAVGSGALGEGSAVLVSALGDPDLLEPPTQTQPTVCADERVHPAIEPNPFATTPVDCANQLVTRVGAANLLPPTPGLLGGVLDPTVSDVQRAVDSVVRIDLDAVLPAAFTPRMRVDVRSWIAPPLLPLITNTSGGTMHTTATAYRRFKNAVVVPIVPSQRLRIDAGLADPVDVITEPVNLNLALRTSQQKLIAALDDADARLNTLMGTYGLPCRNLLANPRQDLRDIYDPPNGPAPTALEIAEAAVTAARKASDRTAIPEPDPNDPGSLAGEAFLLIGVTVDALMNPVAATQVPIVDAALVVMRRTSDGEYRAATVSAANAYGVFRATLVR
ncbi:MAG TPA: hypothetical protein VM840_06555, partial [Actinomycetota bacterium]|nr:hypothetical protein [Actinomycetota bacterium]